MNEVLLSGATALFLCSTVVLLVSHFTVMPVFLRRLRRHNASVCDAIDVGGLRIFLNFTIARMFFFIIARTYLRFPPDMHRPGKILLYTWAYPLLIGSVALLSLVAYSLVTGQRLDRL